MWTTVLTNPQFSLEPIELRMLKRQLATVTCKCETCTYAFKPLYEKVAHLVTKKDREVQAERCHIVEPRSKYAERNFKDALCPTCCMTMNILRGGIVKVLKDEESETLTSMFCSDKATGKRIKSVEKTTSVTTKPLPQFSNLTLCDFISEDSSVGAVTTNATNTPPSLISARKRCHKEKVKFLDTPSQIYQAAQKPFSEFDCTCIENFIDSIRPPLDL